MARRRLIDGQPPPGPSSEFGYCPVCQYELREGEKKVCAECRAKAVCPVCKPDHKLQAGEWRIPCSTACKLKQDRLQYRQADEWARAAVENEKRKAKVREMPKPMTVGARLAMPFVEEDWRVRDWQLVGQKVGLNAQWKAGKTTAMVNLATCLADGRPWLGAYEVKKPEGRIAVLDFEMTDDRPGPLDEWYRHNDLQDKDRVLIYGLRGLAGTFNLLDDEMAAWWVAQLKQEGVGYVILDCLRPVLDALGLNEHTEAGAFLVRFDAMLTAAGIREAVLVQHMGHQKADGSAAGRARGDSRLMDWPDVSWTLERKSPNDPRSARSLAAYGRSVDVERVWLQMDEKNRLTVATGEQQDEEDRDKEGEAFRELVLAVLKVIRESGPTSQNSIRGSLGIRGASLSAAVDWVMDRKLATKGKQRDPYRLTAAGVAFLDTKGHGKWDKRPEPELPGEEAA